MKRCRNTASNLNEREKCCIRKKLECLTSSVNGTSSRFFKVSPPNGDGTGCFSLMVSKTPSTSSLKSITCPYCCDVLNEPITLPECGHTFCRKCIGHFSTKMAGSGCFTCGVIIPEINILRQMACNSEIENQIILKFPSLKQLLHTLQIVREKRLWYELHYHRIRVGELRREVLAVRNEKCEALKMLKEKFCDFVRTTKKNTALQKAFNKDTQLLQHKENIAQLKFPLNDERQAKFARLPSNICCLEYLTKLLETSICSGSQTLLNSYSLIHNTEIGEINFPPCSTCGNELEYTIDFTSCNNSRPPIDTMHTTTTSTSAPTQYTTTTKRQSINRSSNSLSDVIMEDNTETNPQNDNVKSSSNSSNLPNSVELKRGVSFGAKIGETFSRFFLKKNSS